MRRFDQINVIPFIDIMLVLLAIVLTTASFIVQGRLDIDLPPAEQVASAPQAVLEIAIDRDHKIYLDDRSLDLDSLGRRLAGTDPLTPITLRVDSRVQFARFVEIIDLLKAHGLERVSILTRRPT